MDRREFVRTVGAATAGIALAGCTGDNDGGDGGGGSDGGGQATTTTTTTEAPTTARTTTDGDQGTSEETITAQGTGSFNDNIDRSKYLWGGDSVNVDAEGQVTNASTDEELGNVTIVNDTQGENPGFENVRIRKNGRVIDMQGVAVGRVQVSKITIETSTTSG